MEKSLSQPGLEVWRRDIQESIAVKQRVLADEALLRRALHVAQLMAEAVARGNRVLFAGNGGSAADAQHLAAEFVSRFEFDRPGLPALSLATDTSMLTAILRALNPAANFSRRTSRIFRIDNLS